MLALPNIFKRNWMLEKINNGIKLINVWMIFYNKRKICIKLNIDINKKILLDGVNIMIIILLKPY